MRATCALLGSMPGSSPMLSTVRSSFPLRRNRSRYDNPRRRRPPLFPCPPARRPAGALPGPDRVREGRPVRTADNQCRAMRIRGVTDRDDPRQVAGDLDAVLASAEGTLPPFGGCQILLHGVLLHGALHFPSPICQALDGHYPHYLSAYVLMTARESSGRPPVLAA